MTFEDEIKATINRHSRENGSDTPDFILAGYLSRCLELFDETLARREDWYGRTVGGMKSPAPDLDHELPTDTPPGELRTPPAGGLPT